MKSLTTLCLIIILLIVSCNKAKEKMERLDLKEISQNEIKFEWKSFELDGVTYEHGAMILPVYVKGVKREFKMQFDLGLNVSAIYENSLKTILTKHSNLKEKIESRNNYEVLKTNFSIGNYGSSLDSLFVYKGQGELTTYDSLTTIGSIGANEIQNKILIIDFPNTKIQILKSSKELEDNKYHTVPLEYKYGKLFIPITIDGQTYNYIYDTGASISAITTIDKSLFNKVKDNSVPVDTMKLNTWGTLATFLESKIVAPIKIGELDLLSNNSILFTEEQTLIETLNQVNVDGLVGNDFFIDHVIMVDLINNKFGIKTR